MTADKESEAISIGRRIKAARQAKGLTQKDFAASVGIVQGFLSGIEREKKKPSDTLLIALCHYYRINEEWLYTGAGDMFREPDITGGTIETSPATKTPLLKKIPEGFPEKVNQEEMKDYVLLPNVPEGCYATIAYGDFMAPTIRDGDLVTFSPAENIENGDIVLVNNRWGDAILRKYRLKGTEVFLVSDNPVYSHFKPDPETRMIGKVLEVWRKIKI
jgi:SOS-response transcriptional repressor LexA